MLPRDRLLALGGVIGPVCFVGGWTLAGSSARDYSQISNAISELASVDASTRGVMSTAFVLDGAGLIAFGLGLRNLLDGPAWIAAVVTGVATLGVATAPLGGPTGDATHAIFAGIGYASTAALPVLGARPLEQRDSMWLSRISRLTGLAAAGALAVSTFGPAHGLWQRIGLTIGDAWIITVASLILAGRIPLRRSSARFS